ncbi:Pelle-like serine/threonine-protein kinase pik-1 [Anthophora plagiata]
MCSSGCTDKIYIYQLPFFERSELCKLLNQDDKWEELAGTWMDYDVLTIQSLRKEKNPTDELLTMWGHHNHSVLELFVLLSRMQHYQSMVPLKPFVSKKFHLLLYHGESNFHKRIIKEQDTKEESYKIVNQPIPPIHIGAFPDSYNNSFVVSVEENPLPASSQHVQSNGKKDDAIIFNAEGGIPYASYNELSAATNEWNKDNILGRGGFGTVYRGIWKNTNVAIKRIEKKGANLKESCMLRLKYSLREVDILDSCRHENILPLYACSLVGKIPCLVYQLMENGSLEDRLLVRQKTQPLSWIERHEIAKGTACGLQYLHTLGKKPLIHGDIKSANILLDKNLEPRIGDFGLARKVPESGSMKVKKIDGTKAYLPLDFLYGRKLSTKVDTYSYGIVLFELATGLSAYDKSRLENRYLRDFINSWEDKYLSALIDEKAGEKNKQVFNNLMVLGKWCANPLASDRPEMNQVFKKLHHL